LTDQDITRLQQIAAEGASILRAAAALKRNTSPVAKVARRHGIELAGTRQLKAPHGADAAELATLYQRADDAGKAFAATWTP
jgi:transcriptional regulator of nitric oxide reductase